jgi:L-threonylcarbamoyladenylate synthase
MPPRPTVLDAGSDEALTRGAEALRAGGLVAFPTETVYGLGANALDAAAVHRVFAAKGRPAANPVIVHLAGAEEVGRAASDWPEAAGRLAERFWPGPLTFVLPRAPALPAVVTAGGPTVAVRVPAHPVARELIRRAGVPVAAPSANRSTRLSPTRAEHVLRDLAGAIDLILDGGPTAGGIESTVLDVTGPRARLLRPGLVSRAEIEAVIGPVDAPVGVDEAVALPSPGMMARHYAPRTPLEAVEGDGAERVRALAGEGKRVAWVTWFAAGEVPSGAVLVRLPSDPAGYAARLYAALHELDQAGVERIVVALPPAGDGWLAVRDRLRRASVP